MLTYMKSNPKGLVIIEGAISNSKSLDHTENALVVNTMFPLLGITNVLANIASFPTGLSKLKLITGIFTPCNCFFSIDRMFGIILLNFRPPLVTQDRHRSG
jgi:hypothetical protein